MASEAKRSPEALAALLLAFAAAPGQYPVRLGEPRLLYHELDTVAAWALGRVPPALQHQAGPLAQAAVLFVQRACFAAGHTHYQVLGLPAGTIPAEQLRSRYRALIRLTHPDMAVQGLPPDAAGIVNRAHEVLSNPALRAAYDEKLAERAAVAPSRGRLRAEVPRIDHRVGWGERLASWSARYPGALRAVSIITVVGVVALGLLTWAARDVDTGRMLVVAEALNPQDDNGRKPAATNAPALPYLRAPGPTSPPQAEGAARPMPAMGPAAVPAALASKGPEPTAALAPNVGPLTERSAEQSPAPPRDLSANDSPRATSSSLQAVVPDQPTTDRTSPAGRVAERAPEPTVTVLAAPARPIVMQAVPAPLASPPPAAIEPPTPTREVRAAPPPQAAPMAKADADAAPGPPATANRVWTVDAVGSLDYLNEIVTALERPARARQTQRYLRDMRVKGSLLQPALNRMADYQVVNVQRLGFTDAERPGVLNVWGTLVLQPSGPVASDSSRVRYRLSAEFWGTREGTVLGVLDLRETE